MKHIFLLSLLLLAGCAVGPNYSRPDVPVPPRHRFDTQDPATPSIAETKWTGLFQDDVLHQLVQTALSGNFDLSIATQRVIAARNQSGIQRSFLYPALNGSAQWSAVRNSGEGIIRFPSTDASVTQAGFALSWELDFWGRLRRLTEAARADYLASEHARNAVITTVVADVTAAYISLRELDLELEIARNTRDVAQTGLRLTTLRHNQGAATGLDVHQAEQFLYTATAQIASAERQIAQTENFLRFLTGQSPGEVPRGRKLEEILSPRQIPAGLPSSLLERRPDIRQAEAELISANAQIGAARAQYFPQISLTGFLGGQSRSLLDLFSGPAQQFSFVPAATAPLFNAGRIRSGVRISEARKQEAVFVYKQAVENGFREVSDSLIGHTKTSEQRQQQELLVGALRETDRLSNLRYRGGLDSYLQVLDAQRNLFQADLVLAQLRRQELIAVVQLYRALGGGWN
ncbi:MAG: efflux transporter outer membrane subunit [Acidobacteria bacterium]|nr:efflux transporter outer membrane subunit [Acidobacteriota bacterium]